MTCDNLELPPGFRFHPTDDELVMHYLCRKCASQPISVPIIAEIDLYKFDPWQLPEMALYGEKEWYFFSPRDRKYPNGSRPNRAAGTGYWKATGADKPIGKPKPVGIKKALVFYAGKAPRGVKTNWIMHEYRLANVDRSAGKRNNNLRLDDWVLCRIYNKKGTLEKHYVNDNQSSEMEVETKPKITQNTPAPAVHPPASVPHHVMNDVFHFDTSESVPTLHTDSSPEHEREVQSDPKQNDVGFSYMDPFQDDGFTPQSQYYNDFQLSPLQDMFMYTPKQWRSLTFSTGGSKTYIPKNFYRTGGSKTYIPKNFYTKTTYITLLSEKFGGSGAPPGPFKAAPMHQSPFRCENSFKFRL